MKLDIRKGFRTIVRFVKKNRSTIMTALSVAGVVGTFVTTIAANEKANERRHEAQAEKGEYLTGWERFKTEAPAYILPGALCLLTSGTIVWNDILNVKQRTGLIAAACMGAKAYQSLTDEQKVELTKLAAEKNKEKAKIPGGEDGKILFYDDFSERYFWEKPETVRCAELDVSNKMLCEDICELNQFYKSIGNDDLPPIPAGNDLGWSRYLGEIWYGYYYPEFIHTECELTDGTKCIAITMPYPPTADYMCDIGELEGP